MANKNWEYGGHAQKYDMTKPFKFKDGSILQVHDWTDGIPEYMKNIDVLFTDSPWNLSNVSSFYTKAEKDNNYFDFDTFYQNLFKRIDDVNPNVVFLEIGKEYLAEYIMECKKRFKYVTFYNNTYYGKHRCYIIQATNEFKRSKYNALDGLDEEKAIKWITENVPMESIGDLCMGKGLVAFYGHRQGIKFYGTELNPNRLACAIERIRTGDRKIGGQ